LADVPVTTLGLILLTASLVAMLTRRCHFPYSIGLVAAGYGLGFLPQILQVPLSRDLIFTVFLPPLIFEAALQLKWPAFRRELPATLLLAFPGVFIAATAVALGVHFLLNWSWIGAALFGVLIAATDPISVIAAFKEMRVEERLSLLVESESLLNDGAAAVGFGVLTVVAAGGSTSALTIAGSLAWTIAGGVVVGGLVAGLLLLVAGRTVDHLVEITLTTIAAYGSFLLAEHFGMSGVLASLTAGLLVGNVGLKGAISESGRDHVLSFWQYAAFLANSVIFILIGGHEAHQPIAHFSGAVAIAIALVLIGRVLAVYPLCLLLIPTPLRIGLRYQHVLVWGGLRGALALALALALPENIPERQEIIVVAFAVVAFSILVQGLSMPWLIRSLGFATGQIKQQ
jgi:CPA1 family monovalent cation:H+ antiporter